MQTMLKFVARLSKALIALTASTKNEGVSKVFRDETNQAEAKSDIKSPISREIDHRSVSSTSNTDQQEVASISTTEFSVPIDQSNLVSNRLLLLCGGFSNQFYCSDRFFGVLGVRTKSTYLSRVLVIATERTNHIARK